jgi:pimeloyl-ACP methyl ester carboxylesterase
LQNSEVSDRLHLPYLEAAERDFSICRDMDAFSEETIIASDGVRLKVLEAGNPSKPTVLLVNALGVSCLFLSRLAKALAGDYHLLSWESRGLPDYASAEGEVDVSVERHSKDVTEILAHKGREAAAVVAYCAGANVAVHAIANGMLATRRLCIISPSMEIGDAAAKTNYQRTMLPIWEKMSEMGPRYASLVRALIQQNQKPHDGTLASELHQLNNLPFRSPETTYRYALLQAACLKFDWASLLGKVKMPALVMHGTEDDMIHEETSATVAAGIDGASFLKLPDCGHFAIYTSDTLHERVHAFLAGGDGGDDRKTRE